MSEIKLQKLNCKNCLTAVLGKHTNNDCIDPSTCLCAENKHYVKDEMSLQEQATNWLKDKTDEILNNPEKKAEFIESLKNDETIKTDQKGSTTENL